MHAPEELSRPPGRGTRSNRRGSIHGLARQLNRRTFASPQIPIISKGCAGLQGGSAGSLSRQKSIAVAALARPACTTGASRPQRKGLDYHQLGTDESTTATAPSAMSSSESSCSPGVDRAQQRRRIGASPCRRPPERRGADLAPGRCCRPPRARCSTGRISHPPSKLPERAWIQSHRSGIPPPSKYAPIKIWLASGLGFCRRRDLTAPPGGAELRRIDDRDLAKGKERERDHSSLLLSLCLPPLPRSRSVPFPFPPL